MPTTRRLVIIVLMASLAASLLAVCGLLAACGFGGTTFKDADSGKTVDVTVGKQFTVKLDENMTTGYSWRMTADPGLTLVSSDYKGSGSTAAGAGGTRVLVYRADSAGTYKIHGDYLGPDRLSPSPGGRTFDLTVVAK